ncbi:MAG TPA: NUDIX hydrolase [Actinomycetota bacterium]|nr:NUDIX hydrolase [Actinomycetota bacterium]
MGGDHGDIVQAAGGILIRGGPDDPEVAIVHRPKYDDWSFPKGKLERGEDHLQAALREVEEETGLRASVGRELGMAHYRDRFGRPKEVRYWLMRPEAGAFTPTREVDELRWLPPMEAIRLLSYPHDRELLVGVGPELGLG